MESGCRIDVAPQVEHGPIVLSARKRHHLLHVTGRQLFGRGRRGRIDDLQIGSPVRNQSAPVALIQPLQVVHGIRQRVSRRCLHQEPDHAGLQIQIRQQDLAGALPRHLRSHMARDGGGAASRPWRRERRRSCRRAKYSCRPFLCCPTNARAPRSGARPPGGYRYSLTPARRAVRMASGCAELCSAKTAGCALVERSRFTTSSKGSLSLVTSSRITSGCTRSMRSRNGPQSCGISDASKARRIGSGARACLQLLPQLLAFDNQSSGNRIHSKPF